MYEMNIHDPADIFDRMNEDSTSLPGYVCENESTFSATDLGGRGVKLELGRSRDELGAIILPSTEVKVCGEWVLEASGCNKFGLPKRVMDLLKRLLKDKRASLMLERGDKARIKEALDLMEG